MVGRDASLPLGPVIGGHLQRAFPAGRALSSRARLLAVGGERREAIGLPERWDARRAARRGGGVYSPPSPPTITQRCLALGPG